jgi:hypothetical protein
MPIGDAVCGVAMALKSVTPSPDYAVMDEMSGINIPYKQGTATKIYGAVNEIGDKIVVLDINFRTPNNSDAWEDINMAAHSKSDSELRRYLEEVTGREFPKQLRARGYLFKVTKNPDESYRGAYGLNDWQRCRKYIDKAFYGFRHSRNARAKYATQHLKR